MNARRLPVRRSLRPRPSRLRLSQSEFDVALVWMRHLSAIWPAPLVETLPVGGQA
jgi:hypothetical protein